MKNLKIKTINNNTAEVTKAFQKQAAIFGTEEYKLWREYLKDFPEAVMTTKTIKKNPDKKTTRNMTYANMREYIKTQEDAENLLKEFDRQIKMSKIQKNPYRFVLEWFKGVFKGYESHPQFADQEQQDKADNNED